MSLRNVFIGNLKFYRKKAGFSQQELAERCDIATNYLSEIERGQKFPSIEMIERISSELKMPAYLLFLDGQTTVNSGYIEKKRNNEFCEKLESVISKLLIDYGLKD